METKTKYQTRLPYERGAIAKVKETLGVSYPTASDMLRDADHPRHDEAVRIAEIYTTDKRKWRGSYKKFALSE
jgi:hypothetical protein